MTEPEPLFRRCCLCIRVNLVRCDHLQIASGSRKLCYAAYYYRCSLTRTSNSSIEILGPMQSNYDRRKTMIVVKEELSALQGHFFFFLFVFMCILTYAIPRSLTSLKKLSCGLLNAITGQYPIGNFSQSRDFNTPEIHLYSF